ncbi:uncharacterized protein LOC120787590 [Xiphias gladius]|nr:uncharacterized protein LOC120787590 [Xiphias gladius]XP_039979223.1 uncharacterized protein LOC120787590 [Xiphias gladius]XP_039979225.1 uncharacterized protein LOC120787590 [Xiphias gladius]
MEYSAKEGVFRINLPDTVSVQRSVVLLEQEKCVDQFMLAEADDIPELSEVPASLWASHKYDVGLIRGAEPLVVHPKSEYRPCLKQYPLKKEAIDGITPVFESLLKSVVIIPCNSPVRTPIFPVKKVRGEGRPPEWRFVQDLKAVNAAVYQRAPEVKAVLPSPAAAAQHHLKPGDWVLIKDHRRKHWKQRRYIGPFQVLLVTETAVKVDGRAPWIHASHCKRILEVQRGGAA